MNDTNPDANPPRVEAQFRLAAIVESSDDAIVSKSLEGIIMSWNRGAERIFGWTEPEVVGKPILIIIPPERHHEEPMILDRIRRGERVDHFETIRMRKDGRRVEISVTSSPVRDPSGRIVGVSKIARDISAQKQFERELTAAKEAAESANRAKDHFLSVLSHELRTPLTPVLGAISHMERSPALPAEMREQVGMIRRNVETEARLVDDLLDLTRIARGKMHLHFEVVDAHQAVRSVLAMLQSDMDAKSLAVTVALRAREPHVWADPGRFQQMLLNMLSNAVKFTPPEGTITVRSGNPDAGGADGAGGAALAIEIADNGVGIEPHVMPHLFEAFVQGEQSITRRFGGLGLGLSIVKSLADLHRGTIHAHSEGKNRGARFTLRVPTVPAEQALAQAQPHDATPVAGAKPRRVLLVEDHDDTRQVMTMLLRTFGCEVSAAASVREAIALADRQPFDVLVSDIGLPDGSGIDVMRHVRERFKIKGIAVSGFGQDTDLARSRDAGFETHLTKPVSFKTLQDAIVKVAG